MDNTDKQIKKVIKLHMDSEAYYRTCAHITTEDDLVELFNSLSKRRRKMTQSLAAVSPFKSESELWSLNHVFSYLQHMWQDMKLALIINNRQQILQHCFKNEQDILQEYEQLGSNEDSEALSRQRIQHQLLLKDNLRQINAMPIEKYSRQKNMQYPMQKAA